MNSIGLFIFIVAITALFSTHSYANQDEYYSSYDVVSSSEYYDDGNTLESQDFDAEPSYYDIHHEYSEHNKKLMYVRNDSNDKNDYDSYHPKKKKKSSGYSSRLPQQISGYHEKVILINPRAHAWGAYNSDGQLIRSGLATAGSGWCPDIHRSCRTKSGSFRIQSLGSSSCKSSKYPIGKGGAPMPYCMFFNGKQGLHGSHEVVEGNVSHGCVRVRVSDAEWIRFNFATIGTKVIVTSY